MHGWDSNQSLHIEDAPAAAGTRPPQARVKWVAGDYFETLRIPLLVGSGLTWDHARSRAKVVVVNEAYAREHWGDVKGALGKRIRYDTEAWHRIVGVAADTHDDGLAVAPVPTVYWPLVVDGFWGARPWVPRWFAYAVRTSRPEPTSLVPEIRRVIRATNPNVPLFEVQTLQDIVDRSIARTTFTLTLLAGTTLVAILLAIVGIYGVIAYTVSQRTREMGLRLALGARPRDVLALVLGNGLTLALAGVVVGALVSLGLTRVMATLLFGVRPTDPLTYALAAAGIVVVALAATYVPAARASRVDPVRALAAD